MQKTQKLVLCALFTALTTIATMVIQMPLSVSGYINMGDVFVLFGAFMLGPLFGAVSAGVGSMLADILTGYVVFAPATLIIKAIMALVYFFLFKWIEKLIKVRVAACIIAGIVAELIMVFGYFIFSALFMSEGLAAAASIPGNLIQGGVGVAVSTVLVILMPKKINN